MKVLFTKKISDKEIVDTLGTEVSYSFVDVIKTNHLAVEPFFLKDKSLIFSSINGVDAFFANGFEPNEDFTSNDFNKIYCVGQKTKKRLRKYGFNTFKVAKHASELAEFIIENCSGEKFLHFCGNLALNILDKSLPLQNIYYKKVPIYETILLYPSVTQDFDAIAFFSPSGVRSFLKFNSIEGKKIFSIGETTEKEIRKYTSQNIFVSQESNVEDLLEIMKNELL